MAERPAEAIAHSSFAALRKSSLDAYFGCIVQRAELTVSIGIIHLRRFLHLVLTKRNCAGHESVFIPASWVW